MKYLIILILLLCSCTKEKLEVAYTVKKGENVFTPRLPQIPFQSNTLSYQFMIGQEWWEGDLTEPAGFGCKLLTLGNYNYHTAGANSAISYANGEVYWSARYYEPITDSTYLLHELPLQIMLQPDRWYTVKMTMEPLRWWFDGIMVYEFDFNLPHFWLTWQFLGRSGRDQNYPGGDIPGAWAVRELTLKIIK